MHRLVLAASSVCLLAAPVAASADPTPTPGSPAQQCRTERAGMGLAAFKATYGTNRNRSNAFGKCVSKRAKAARLADQQAAPSAAQTCRSEQTDPNFAASHGNQTFEQFYGTNPNGKNAFGKCVSQHAKARSDATQQTQVTADVSAAKQCKAERNTLGRDAFAVKYGTNHNRRNAFGKCVSGKARTLVQTQSA
jgi:hypothetical protein